MLKYQTCNYRLRYPSYIIIFFSSFVLFSACSVNDKGLVRVERFETPTATLLTLESYGGHFSTFDADRGLTLGWTRQIYAFPRQTLTAMDDRPVPDLQNFLSRSHRVAPLEDESGDTSSADDPFLVASQRRGFVLDINEHRTGIMLGWQERAAILINRNSEAIVFVRLDLNAPDNADIYIWRK